MENEKWPLYKTASIIREYYKVFLISLSPFEYILFYGILL